MNMVAIGHVLSTCLHACGIGYVCALCCTKSDLEKMSMCDKCQLQYCTDCIDVHTCDNVTVR